MAFKEVRFPDKIAYGATGGPLHSTNVIVLGSGHEQRDARWSEALLQFNVATGIKKSADLEALIAFNRVMRGRFHGFRFKDHSDFKSVDRLAPIGPNDQSIGIGDDVDFTFQLKKLYAFGAENISRDIKKPVSGTVRVAVDTIEVFNFTVNLTTGIVTFTTLLSVSGTDIEAVEDSNGFFFSSLTTDFSGFSAGQRIETSGFANPTNNRSGATFFTIIDVQIDSNNAGSLFVTETTANEGAGASVTINRHPAPDTGEAITAGFEFDVPARFETDLMAVNIRSFDHGVWEQIIVQGIRV